MLDSIRKPLGVRRFLANVLHAADFTRYRIDRVPQYELRRCGLGSRRWTAPPHWLYRPLGRSWGRVRRPGFVR